MELYDYWTNFWPLALLLVISAYMFNDTLRGGVDVASAKMRNLYTRASKNWGLSSFGDDELNETERARNIKKFRHAHVGGLYNEGNTCFMNSVIQALASCDPIVDYVAAYKDDTNFSGGLGDTIENLNQIHTRQHGYATLKLMRQIGGGQRWNRYNQEDAQEFFQELLTTLENDRKRVEKTQAEALNGEKPDESASSDDDEKKLAPELQSNNEKAESEPELEPEPESKVPKRITPFDGTFAVRVGCLRCGDMEGIRQGVVSSVDLNLGLDTNQTTLTRLFQDYTAMETISGVECYRCTLNQYREALSEKLESVESQPKLQEIFRKRLAEVDSVLKEKVIDDKQYVQMKPADMKLESDKSKQTMFASPSPDVLMIHINRSAFDLRTGIVRKNFAQVDFPSVFDLSDFVIDPKDPANQDPHFAMKGVSAGKRELYDLKAVVIHYGSANFGHYISFRKFHGLWWRISDDQVDLTTESQVLNAQGVFMLFYEKEGVSTRPEVPLAEPIVDTGSDRDSDSELSSDSDTDAEDNVVTDVATPFKSTSDSDEDVQEATKLPLTPPI